MYIRELGFEEILSALHLVWEVYANQTLPLEKDASIRAFQEYIKYERIMPEVQEGKVKFFGAWEDAKFIAAGAIERNARISLLYVRREYQGMKVGKKLFEEMSNYAFSNWGVNQIRVDSPVVAAPFFRHLGMENSEKEQTIEGITFQPLLYVKDGSSGKSKKVVRITVAVVVAIALTAGLVIGRNVRLKRAYSVFSYPPMIENPFEGKKEEAPKKEENSGFASVEEYTKEGTKLTLEEKEYKEMPEDMKNTVVQFQIKYPQLEGADSQILSKVNGKIKKCAMETANRLYNDPDQETIEKMLSIKNPVMISHVDYKVTYLSDEYVCVLFNDEKVEGTMEQDHFVELRSVVFNLKNGKEYKLEDLVKLNRKFLHEWKEKMQEETGDEKFLDDFTIFKLKDILKGEDTEKCTPIFFVKKDGLEIGLNFHDSENETKSTKYQWVTAPFSYDEIAFYRTNEKFVD